MLLLIVLSFCLISTTFTWAPDASDDVFVLKNKFNAQAQALRSIQNPTSTVKNDRRVKYTNARLNPQTDRLPTIAKQLRPDAESTSPRFRNPKNEDRSMVKFDT